MYKDEYKRWVSANLEDPDLLPELLRNADDDEVHFLGRFGGRETKPLGNLGTRPEKLRKRNLSPILLALFSG